MIINILGQLLLVKHVLVQAMTLALKSCREKWDKMVSFMSHDLQEYHKWCNLSVHMWISLGSSIILPVLFLVLFSSEKNTTILLDPWDIWTFQGSQYIQIPICKNLLLIQQKLYLDHTILQGHVGQELSSPHRVKLYLISLCTIYLIVDSTTLSYSLVTLIDLVGSWLMMC